ncbi:MAG: phosphatase PAP2 family protein [Thermodesulfovibrionia bacterium]|nr:MAG: phosphatase PAP2 family protein [Thermodesulfovibrionia bacterium]
MTNKFRGLVRKASAFHKPKVQGKRKLLTFLLLFFYAIFLLFFITYSRFSLRLSYLIPLMFPFALIERRPLKFIYNWSPFYFVIFFYDLFRGIADDLTAGINFTLLPSLERAIFGGVIPTVWLQQSLDSISEGVFGTILTFFYFGHFILPVTVLYLLWRKNLKLFRIGLGSITLVSIFAFITFVIFPAAPPWMASIEGVIPETKRLVLFHLTRMLEPLALPQIYIGLNPNEVAPFPSLHAAYATMFFLLSNKYFPRFRWIFLANTLVVSFTLVLFAEHYVVDVAAGWLYSLATFTIIEKLPLDKQIWQAS